MKKMMLSLGMAVALCAMPALGSVAADEPCVVADTVVYGTIRTAEANNPVVQALAVKDGKFVYVGDKDGAEEFVKEGVTRVIDRRGKGMVMPGCTDGHSHYALKFGLDNMKGGVMFALEDDKTNVLRKVEAAAKAAKAAGKKSLFGFGWNFVTLVQDQPTLAELDAATNGEDGGEKISMVVLDNGGHHAFCNTECLKRCGIIDGEGNVLVKEIEGGYLELDDNEYPTGYVEERAMGYLMRMGGIDYDELMDDEVAEISIRKTRDLLLSTGYTIALEGWSNILHSNKLYRAAKTLDENDELNLVFPMTYEVEPWQTNMTEQIDYLAALNETYRTRHVLPEYLKIFMDGVVETKTGAMLMPYKDDHEYYKSFWSTNRLADITRECNATGLTVHVHTMGDAAIRDTVTAYIMGGDGKHRNCLVHLRNVSTNEVNDFERIAENNIACSAGFTWHVAGKEAELLEMFLEKDYIEHAYPIKSFFDAGVRVSSHSDFPANAPCPQDPFGIMEVALTGQRPDLPEDEKLAPYDTNELVTVEQVFEALTINGAWQLGLENERGSIAVGKWADFVLADQDVFTCATTDIHKTKVVSTWFEGEKVYDAPPAGTADDPWQIGKTAGDEVIAYTNAAGRLFVEGRGEIRDFCALGGGLWFNATTTEVEFGPAVKSIGANMLATCSKLERIVMYAEEPPELGENALPSVWQLDAIYVPAESYDDYTWDFDWSDYELVIEGAAPGSEELPWKVGATDVDTVATFTNGKGRLAIIGEGVMQGFATAAPWASGDLTEAVVGEGVGSFGANCFAECPNLKTLVVYAAEPPALGDGNDLSDAKIFVPAGKAAAYRAAWPTLADRIDEMRSDKGESLTPHLYEMTYKWWDATKANDIGEDLAALMETLEWVEEICRRFFPYGFPGWYEDVANRALCTSCRNGNFIGRNFDWGYDDVDECVMHIPAAKDRLASVGVASWFFPKWMQDAFDVDEFLPELTMDGVNEKGVAINVNVVPGGDNGWTTGTNSNATKRLCAGFAVRTVLDNATNAAHAVEILQSRDIYSLKPLEFHWMISDADESYIVECVSNALVVLKAHDARPKMANFYVSHSPSVCEYDILTNAELTAGVHTPHAMGVERYANVSNGLESVDSVEAMFTHMTNVWYKLKYLPGNEQKYWSDLNGAPIPDEYGQAKGDRFEFGDGLDEARSNAFKRIQANYVAVTNYEARWGIRDTLKYDPTLTNQVVHTVHTSIYDLKRRELTVCVQEDAGWVQSFDLIGMLVPGSERNPWKVGTEGHEAEVKAWTNGTGTLVVEGVGEVGWMPWTESPMAIAKLVKGEGVTGLERIVGSLPGLMTVNGLTHEDFGSAILGFVKAAGFSAIAVDPATQSAELDVVVSRADSLDKPIEWTPVSTNRIPVKAEGSTGFFIVVPGGE